MTKMNQDKKEKLAQALRENLMKRKQQSRLKNSLREDKNPETDKDNIKNEEGK